MQRFKKVGILAVAFAVLFAAPGLVMAAENDGSTAPTDVVPAAQQFPCGAGFTFTRVGVSATGNISQFESPAGQEHLNAFLIRNGYQVCHNGGGGFVSSFDIGTSSGGFGGAVCVQPNGVNTFPLECSRTTLDGAITITRRITGNSFVAAGGLFDLNGDGVSCSTMAECGNCTNRTIHVLTRVTNNTGLVQSIRIVEIADVDIGSFGSTDREFGARTADSATIFNTPGTANPSLQGILVQSLITAPLTAIQPFGGTPVNATCDVPSIATPTPHADFELAVRQDLVLGAFATNSGSIRTHYRRY
jgi:hypothetical protein